MHHRASSVWVGFSSRAVFLAVPFFLSNVAVMGPLSLSPCPRIRKAFDVLKFIDQLEQTPGFGNAIGFSFRHLSPDQFRFDDDDDTLKIRMSLTESFLWKDSSSPSPSLQRQQPVGLLSTFAALVDEVTTVSLIVDDDGRPGVTVLLSMEAGPALHDDELRTGKGGIEITSIVQKKGQNMAFTRAEIRLVSTGRLVCWGSHIKFLNNLSTVGNLLVSSRGWPLLKAYGNMMRSSSSSSSNNNHIKEDDHGAKTLAELFSSLQSDGRRATFTVDPALSSLVGGPLHGGSHAILLERAAESALPSTDLFQLDSMRVEYISTPNYHPEIKMEVSLLPRNNGLVVVTTELWSRGKLNSTGVFRYSKERLPLSKM